MSTKKMSRSESGKLGAIKSTKIANAQKALRIREYNKDPVPCRSCGDPLTYDDVLRKKKFHNSSCAAKFNNIGTRRHGKEPSNCLHCEEKVHSSANLYCNKICHHAHKWTLAKEIIEEGNGSSGGVKKYLLEKFGHKCNGCNLTEWRKVPIPLELEHKDGNSENNSLNNVELLCPNCHALTPTYKGRNTGNGRWKRRQRYADGKSF